jgi:hypothetical protein
MEKLKRLLSVFRRKPRLPSPPSEADRIKARQDFLAKQSRIIEKLYANGPVCALGGVFEGLRYVNLTLKNNVPSALVPKLIGSYEDELTPVWDSVFKNGYDIIVDIGCAEGYYAVGLAIKNPGARVFAYDINENAQKLCREMAVVNGVADRVSVSSEFRSDSLRAINTGGKSRTLIISDCEGVERELMDPVQDPSLLDCDLIIECHDFISRGITELIQSRFRQTHQQQIVRSERVKDPARYSLIQALDDAEKRLSVSEFRPEVMNWLYLTRK